MNDRDAEIAAFLAAAGWGAAVTAPLAGDASNRRYLRLTGGPAGGGAVLMDAPPERGEDVRPFLRIARHLAGLGFSAPDIFAADEALGLLLIEDLGDALYARLLGRDPSREVELYAAAIDQLAALAEAALPDDVPPYSPEMPHLAALAFDWYQRGATGAVDAAARADFLGAFAAALAVAPVWGETLALRDYHAENLIWLPDRQGAARVGLLDFQDARTGHPVYDLVSLLEDARRDVGGDTAAAMRARYRDIAGVDRDAFDAACAVMAAQRNLRILGVFARLSMHFGKPAYIDLIPRVWRHLQADLAHPALAFVAPILRAALPPPDPAILTRLKDLCGTVPTR